MIKLLGLASLIAVLGLSGTAVACSMEKSASTGNQPVTTATTQPNAPATDGTTTPKSTEVKTGG